MKPYNYSKAKEDILQVLRTVYTLDQADICLGTVTPIPSKARRWGLFEGWNGRELSYTGLQKPQNSLEDNQRIASQYEEAYEMGKAWHREERERKAS